MIVDYKESHIFYTDEGQGDSIIFLHGFLENSSMWTSIIRYLKSSYRVICIDLLGHGQTGCIGYVHTMENMADAVMTVINELNIETFMLIGHSMGGYVALAIAEKHSNLVDGLCLMNSTALEDNAERKLNRDRAIEAVKNNHKMFINISIANLFAPDNRNRLTKEIHTVRQEALKTPLQGIIAALEGMKVRPNREHVLHKTAFKKMMVVGSEDPVLEYNTLMNQVHNLNVEIVEFSGGHMSHIENKKELAYKIMRFIEK